MNGIDKARSGVGLAYRAGYPHSGEPAGQGKFHKQRTPDGHAQMKPMTQPSGSRIQPESADRQG